MEIHPQVHARKTAPASIIDEVKFRSSRFVHMPSQSRNAGREWSTENRPQLRTPHTNSRRATSSNLAQHIQTLDQSFDLGVVEEEEKITVISNHCKDGPPMTPILLKTAYSVVTIALLAVLVFVNISKFQIAAQELQRLSCVLCPSSANYDARIALLEDNLYRLTRDRVARQDFAFRYSGGDIVPNLTTPIHSRGARLNDPIVALDDDLRHGRCWRIHGTSGQLGISLFESVFVTHITIDHVAKELVSSVRNSPRNVTIWGVLEENRGMSIFPQATAPPINNGRDFVLMSSFVYDINAESNIQTFPVFDSYLSMNLSVKVVVVEIVNNWGSDTTCLYRVRVHGHGSDLASLL